MIGDSTYQNQKYNAKIEIRGVDMSPTSIVYLTFITYEATTLREKIIGTSYFPLFMSC